MKWIYQSLQILIFSVVLISIIQPSFSNAQEKQNLPVITVINPIRGNELGLEEVDLLNSLKGQWKVTNEIDIPATWLWQYSALENDQLISFAKKEMKGQEFGLFLEIDRNFATKAGVLYRGRGPWYFSDGLYLLSYDPSERKKFIDTAFSLFYEQFGYYPKTVGAWWLTADSLSYMHDQYGVIASLRAADQFDLDVYSIWGTPWSIPYVASSINAGIPAFSADSNSQVVIMQWASRDPLDGYGRTIHSTYSMQDYTLRGYDLSYFEYLVSTYLNKPFDQAVIGFEGGSEPISYEGQYKDHLTTVRTLEKEKKLSIKKAEEFAQGFLAAGKAVQRPYLLTTAYQSNDQSFWYNSPFMRVGIQKKDGNVFITDMRDYANAGTGEFTVLPNSQGYLRVSTPALFESVRFSNQRQFLAKSSEQLTVDVRNNTVILKSGDQELVRFTPNTVHIVASKSAQPQLYTINQEVQRSYKDIFVLLLVVYIGYFVIILSNKKNLLLSLIHLSLLFIPLLLAFSFLANGQVSEDIFLFDKKQLLLSPLLLIPFFSLFERLFFVFNVVPFLLLLAVHYVFMIREVSWKATLTFGVILLSIIMLFMRLPYFPLDKSTYVYVLGIFALLFLLGGIIIVIVYLRTKSKRSVVTLASLFLFFLFLMSIVTVFSRTQFILTPFEKDALEVIAKQKKQVLYLLPSEEPIYKGIRPVMYEDHYLARYLTNVSWETITIGEKNNIQFPDGEHLLVVPLYLGSAFSEEQAKKMNVKKIFDNGNIVIYNK